MGKPRIYGAPSAYIPNAKADMRDRLRKDGHKIYMDGKIYKEETNGSERRKKNEKRAVAMPLQ